MTNRVALTLLVLAALAQAQVDKVDSYIVTGGSVSELRQSLNRLGPVGPDGKRRDALTRWFVRWEYRTTNSSAGCGLSRFDVSLDTHITMPHWANETQATPTLGQRWRQYYAALRVHEDGHRSIAIEAAAAVREAGARLLPQPTCEQLARNVASTAEGVIDEYRGKEREYDAKTDHGRTQGARFP